MADATAERWANDSDRNANEAPVTLAEAAYQRLRADIVAGTFEAGKPLRLEALRQRYGFSFSPLREALTRLQSDRLVSSTALRGFSVATLSEDEMNDAMETRILIECEALRRAMRYGGDDWEAGIVAAFHAFRLQIERMSKITGTLSADDIVAMEERHQDFHRSLVSACRSPRLLELADRLYVETQRYRVPSLIGRFDKKTRRDVTAEHEEIMDAALRRKDQAIVLLTAHYRRTASMIATSTEWPVADSRAKSKTPR